MKKRRSMRVQITLWFTGALILVVLVAYFVVLSVSNQILQKTIRDQLIEAVESNGDRVRYYASLDQIDRNKNADRVIPFQEGFLELDQDFLQPVNQVYTALYSGDGSLLYGENPISRETMDVKLTDATLQTLRVDGETWYLFDRRLTSEGLDRLWLRGIVSEAQGAAQLSNIARISFVLLPVLVLISSVGGFLLVGRMLRPVEQISETARQIGRENDLTKRIVLKGGGSELHRLADTFNEMFARLDSAAQEERRFLSDASHELRTPTTVITAQCEYALERPRSPEEYREALEVVGRQGRKMSRLIRDMLDFTRLEAGTERYPREPLDLAELVSSLCADMALIREQEITLAYRGPDALRITGHRELLSRLVMNLISNAYRYGRENGHIWVSLKQTADQAVLAVADDGIGISPGEQEKIFGRFYQADRSRAGTGIGLGLAMAREIARFHGGEISVNSAPGQGSTFTVTLPLESECVKKPFTI